MRCRLVRCSVVSDAVRCLRSPAPVLVGFSAARDGRRALTGDAHVDAAGSTALDSLPGEVRQALQDVADRSGDARAVHMSSLVCDPSFVPSWRDEDIAAAEDLVLGIGRVLGEPVGYAGEKAGVLVQHVFPVEAEASSPSNESSSFDARPAHGARVLPAGSDLSDGRVVAGLHRAGVPAW